MIYYIGQQVKTKSGVTGEIERVIYTYPKNQPENITPSSVTILQEDGTLAIVKVSELEPEFTR